MLRLERVVIEGFKSFKRRVSIPFPTGFSVITGPNGSGKTNIADSISFVLGISSSRPLRAKRAQDLIFHGSKVKPSSDYAKVTLVFSKKDKKEEISISRRINKNGISTYRVNGRIVTKEQVIDTLSQMNIHPDGHNMIKQGDVTKVIEMDPIERRKIIDEISGIAEYDEKKEKCLKDLEKVAEKIREAEIILSQKEEIINKLRSERDSALQYKRLQEELEIVRSAIAWKMFSNIKKNLESFDKEISEKEKMLSEIEKQIKEIDKEFSEKENEQKQFMNELVKISDQIEINKRIVKLEGMIERKNDIIELNKREIQRIDEILSRTKRPELKPILEIPGVKGFFSDVLIIPSQYRIAAEVAAGAHMNDIIVENFETAIKCIKYLKEKQIGIARFLPMDKINIMPKQPLPQGCIGWMSDLIHHDIQYTPIVDFVLGRTACISDIDKAKEIFKKQRIRIVTLDGELIEPSGLISGGYYKSKPELKRYVEEREKLEREIKLAALEIEEYEKELSELRKRVLKTKSTDAERRMNQIKIELEKLSKKRRELYDTKLNIQNDLNKFRIEKARAEANFENAKIQWEEYEKKFDKSLEEKSINTLKKEERDILEKITLLGPVNMKAIEDFDKIKDEFEEFNERVKKIIEEKEMIEKSIKKIDERKKEVFLKTLNEISAHFKKVYNELTQGDAELRLENDDINSGLLISASPHGKKLIYIDSMSTGEKALTALAFLFAIQRYKPSPFYILDEIDAALDKVNTHKVVQLIKKHSSLMQFIIISHNSEMVKAADHVYGVSMEDGESKIIGIKLPEEKVSG